LDLLNSGQGIDNDIVDSLEVIESELAGNLLICVHLDAVGDQEF